MYLLYFNHLTLCTANYFNHLHLHLNCLFITLSSYLYISLHLANNSNHLSTTSNFFTFDSILLSNDLNCLSITFTNLNCLCMTFRYIFQPFIQYIQLTLDNCSLVFTKTTGLQSGFIKLSQIRYSNVQFLALWAKCIQHSVLCACHGTLWESLPTATFSPVFSTLAPNNYAKVTSTFGCVSDEGQRSNHTQF